MSIVEGIKTFGRPIASLGVLAVLTLGVGLGGARRLSYHEGIVAQGAREMIAPEGDWLTPTIGGSPWLEKPPLAHWLAAGVGWMAGGVDERAARLPSALAAAALACVVGAMASRRFGPTVGLLAAAVQLTTSWTITRGRLAEADILLALLVAATLSAFDRLRDTRAGVATDTTMPRDRWVFFTLLGATSLAKGVGFGAALALASIAAVLLWDRDRRTLRAFALADGMAARGLDRPRLAVGDFDEISRCARALDESYYRSPLNRAEPNSPASRSAASCSPHYY